MTIIIVINNNNNGNIFFPSTLKWPSKIEMLCDLIY